jgi:hypothetical protein
MTTKIRLWALGSAVLLLAWTSAHYFASLSDTPPMWQLGVCYTLIAIGAMILKRASD